MSETGQVPEERLSEGRTPEQAEPVDGGAGAGERPSPMRAASSYPFLDGHEFLDEHDQPEGEEDDDLLLMPGPQSGWADSGRGSAAPAAPGERPEDDAGTAGGSAFPAGTSGSAGGLTSPVGGLSGSGSSGSGFSAPQLLEPSPLPSDASALPTVDSTQPSGEPPAELDGELPAQSPVQPSVSSSLLPPPGRREPHPGPPVADPGASTGQVSVRSLADRGPEVWQTPGQTLGGPLSAPEDPLTVTNPSIVEERENGQQLPEQPGEEASAEATPLWPEGGSSPLREPTSAAEPGPESGSVDPRADLAVSAPVEGAASPEDPRGDWELPTPTPELAVQRAPEQAEHVSQDQTVPPRASVQEVSERATADETAWTLQSAANTETTTGPSPSAPTSAALAEHAVESPETSTGASSGPSALAVGEQPLPVPPQSRQEPEPQEPATREPGVTAPEFAQDAQLERPVAPDGSETPVPAAASALVETPLPVEESTRLASGGPVRDTVEPGVLDTPSSVVDGELHASSSEDATSPGESGTRPADESFAGLAAAGPVSQSPEADDALDVTGAAQPSQEPAPLPELESEPEQASGREPEGSPGSATDAASPTETTGLVSSSPATDDVASQGEEPESASELPETDRAGVHAKSGSLPDGVPESIPDAQVTTRQTETGGASVLSVPAPREKPFAESAATPEQGVDEHGGPDGGMPDGDTKTGADQNLHGDGSADPLSDTQEQEGAESDDELPRQAASVPEPASASVPDPAALEEGDRSGAVSSEPELAKPGPGPGRRRRPSVDAFLAEPAPARQAVLEEEPEVAPSETPPEVSSETSLADVSEARTTEETPLPERESTAREEQQPVDTEDTCAGSLDEGEQSDAESGEPISTSAATPEPEVAPGTQAGVDDDTEAEAVSTVEEASDEASVHLPAAPVAVQAAAGTPAPTPEDATPEDVVPEDVVPEDVEADETVEEQESAPELVNPSPDDLGEPVVGPLTVPPRTVTPAPGPTADLPKVEAGASFVYEPTVREAVHRVIRDRHQAPVAFATEPVEDAALTRVLEAAHTAPSEGETAPWDFLIVRSSETRSRLGEVIAEQHETHRESLPKGRGKHYRALAVEAIPQAPVAVVVTADDTRGGGHGGAGQGQPASYASALAVENLWLAAHAEGLAVGWVNVFDERELAVAAGLPDHLSVVAFLCLGYPEGPVEEETARQPATSARRPLSWVVHEEEYGRRALPGERPLSLLQESLRLIRPLDAKALGEAWERQKRMTKPSGALGVLEVISAQLCGLSRKCPPPVPEPAAVAVFAGDHGVHDQGVTAWQQEVTTQMVGNLAAGGAVVNAFANQVGAEVCVVDIGVAGDPEPARGLLPRKVRRGTDDLTLGPAMTRGEAQRAVEVGIETARDLVAAGNRALVTGDMGVANTTPSAALIAAFTGADPADVTGRGTGVDDAMHASKVRAVRSALALHQPDVTDPVGVLASVGGLEHAGVVGLLLGAASLRTPVLLDGLMAGAATLVAKAIAPEVLAACVAGHRSAEPGHQAALNALGLRPLVDLDLRLGEGTGALLALPIVQSTARAMHEVATFDTAGVTDRP